MLGSIARKIGFGRAYLKIRHLKDIGPFNVIKEKFNRKYLLPKIEAAKPIPVGAGKMDIHMLLDHARLYEGMWSLKSLQMFAPEPVNIVVHSDGSLSKNDIAKLKHLFPGISIIEKAAADEVVEKNFRDNGLFRCLKFRRELIFGRKLFDPVFFLSAEHYILVDSDVLFFREPTELFSQWIGKTKEAAVFSVDFGFENGYSHKVKKQITQLPCNLPTNAGLLGLSSNTLNFKRIEEYLSQPVFWLDDGKPNWLAEQAIMGIEMEYCHAVPLPSEYQIANDTLSYANTKSVHYCGGVKARNRLYSQALPILSKIIL